jgi:hypothetical protein
MYCRLAEVVNSLEALAITNPQITKKIGPTNRKLAKCHIFERSVNFTNYVRPPIWGFAICGTYMRTAHLCIDHRKHNLLF